MKSKEFKGDKILSLNKIKETNTKVYKKSILKYKNREDELTCYIDMLNCTWSDCVNLSTINPVNHVLVKDEVSLKGVNVLTFNPDFNEI